MQGPFYNYVYLPWPKLAVVTGSCKPVSLRCFIRFTASSAVTALVLKSDANRESAFDCNRVLASISQKPSLRKQFSSFSGSVRLRSCAAGAFPGDVSRGFERAVDAWDRNEYKIIQMNMRLVKTKD